MVREWKHVAFVVTVAATTCLLACANNQPPLPPQPIGETHTLRADLMMRRSDAGGARAQQFESVRVQVTSRLRERCKMPEAPPEPSLFAFDGVDFEPRGEDVLHVVATCLDEPEHEASRLCVSAYIDPRGERGYEEDLGRSHAEAAERYLEKMGLGSERMDVALRNEAVYGDGLARALERRVELDLQDSAACPGRI